MDIKKKPLAFELKAFFLVASCAWGHHKGGPICEAGEKHGKVGTENINIHTFG